MPNALLLDVDGVLIPVTSQANDWGRWVDAGTGGDTMVSLEMTSVIGSLDAERYWLSTWGATANEVICPLVGWPSLPVLEEQTARRWWKLVTVEWFLEATNFDRVAWVDDDLDAYGDEVRESLGGFVDAGRLELVCPVSSVGLARADAERLSAFLGPHPGRATS